MISVEHKTQIRAHKLVCYTKFTGYHFRTESQRESVKKLEQTETYTGGLRPGAKKRLCKSIDLLVQTAKRNWIEYNGKQIPFTLGFTTLTIHSPDRMIDHKECYKNVLSKFLQWLRRVQKCYLYIWKAELQERGQIHYHLLLGSFVDQDLIRKKWNELQRDAGYLQCYFEEHGHYNAPSTEIKNALEHEDISGYLCKEISKDIQNQLSVGGKVWDCSVNLKELSYFECDTDKYAGVISKLAREGELRVGYSDQSCTIYRVNDKLAGNNFRPSMLLDRLDYFLYEDHLNHIRDFDFVQPKKEILLAEKLYPDLRVRVNVQQSLFSRN
jgi:hypothetical protein